MNRDDESTDREFFKPLFHFGIDDVEHEILSPLSHIKDFGANWILEFDLPLVNKNDISINIDSKNNLIVDAKLKEVYYSTQFHSKCEFRYYKKKLQLPEDIDREKISVHFSNGILTITLPKIFHGTKIKVD